MESTQSGITQPRSNPENATPYPGALGELLHQSELYCSCYHLKMWTMQEVVRIMLYTIHKMIRM